MSYKDHSSVEEKNKIKGSQFLIFFSFSLLFIYFQFLGVFLRGVGAVVKIIAFSQDDLNSCLPLFISFILFMHEITVYFVHNLKLLI